MLVGVVMLEVLRVSWMVSWGARYDGTVVLYMQHSTSHKTSHCRNPTALLNVCDTHSTL